MITAKLWTELSTTTEVTAMEYMYTDVGANC